MKKTLFSILLSTSIVGVNYAQSTNLDRNYVNFQYVNKRKKTPMMPH